MSFCRWGEDCNLYIYENWEQEYVCCGCCANGGQTWKTKALEAIIEHVRDHIAMGHKVPDWLIGSLERDEG